MKETYQGFLTGFTPNIVSEKYGAWAVPSVVLTKEDKVIRMVFNSDGSAYSCVCKEIKPGYYQGEHSHKSTSDRMSFWLFIGAEDIVINGNWQEDGIDSDIWGRFRQIK